MNLNWSQIADEIFVRDFSFVWVRYDSPSRTFMIGMDEMCVHEALSEKQVLTDLYNIPDHLFVWRSPLCVSPQVE